MYRPKNWTTAVRPGWTTVRDARTMTPAASRNAPSTAHPPASVAATRLNDTIAAATRRRATSRPRKPFVWGARRSWTSTRTPACPTGVPAGGAGISPTDVRTGTDMATSRAARKSANSVISLCLAEGYRTLGWWSASPRDPSSCSSGRPRAGRPLGRPPTSFRTRSCRPTACARSSAPASATSPRAPTPSPSSTSSSARGSAAASPRSSTPSGSIPSAAPPGASWRCATASRASPSPSTRPPPSAAAAMPPGRRPTGCRRRCSAGQLAAFAEQRPGLDAEGFDAVLTAEPVRVVDPAVAVAVRERRPAGSGSGRRRRGPSGSACTSRRGACPGGARELGPRLRDVGAAAEEAGVDSLWVMDHLRQIPQLGRPWEDMPDAGAVLAHLAAATRRATVGALVHPVSYRDVRLLGRAVATLDVLSGGRAVCGLGAGWYEAEHPPSGCPSRPPASASTRSRTPCSSSRCSGERARPPSQDAGWTCPRR